jgi:hypothetical protein
MSGQFGLAHEEEWVLAPSVEAQRRAVLSSDTGFSEILAMLAGSIRIVRVHLERGGKGDHRLLGHRRFEVTLAADATTIDRWHNARGGYRAQYYVGPDFGAAANQLAAATLLDRINEDLLVRRNLSGMTSDVLRSLRSPTTKVWIYQGQWLRHAKYSSGELHVTRWRQALEADEKAKTLARYAAQLPRDETRVQLIGGWCDVDGEPPPFRLKDRSDQIHRFGFT